MKFTLRFFDMSVREDLLQEPLQLRRAPLQLATTQLEMGGVKTHSYHYTSCLTVRGCSLQVRGARMGGVPTMFTFFDFRVNDALNL